MVSIFKRKGKAAKEAEKKNVEKPTETAPPKPAYKHVPTHAASDSVGQGSRLEDKHDRNHIAIASRRRAENSAFDSTLANASYQQSIAHELAHGTPSPMAPFGSQQRYQDEAYYSEFETPSMAGTPMMHGSAGQMRMSRQSSDYFTQPAHRGRSYESRGQSYGKGKEHGYATPYYSDSGYESAGPPSGLQSRDPSLQDLKDLERQYLSRDNKGLLLPEPRFSDDFTNLSVNTDQLEVADAVMMSRKSQEGVLKNPGNVSPMDLEDSRSTKSATSISKKTRFEDEPEPMPELNHLQHHRDAASAAAEQTASPPHFLEQSEKSIRPEEQSELPVDSARGSPVESDAESEETEHALAQTDAATAAEQQEVQEPAPTPSTQAPTKPSPPSLANDASQRPALKRLSSAPSSRQVTSPPLAILEGLKVNKKGLILDEEGDPIGQLVDGELLDCVRQKANASGEVLDDSGRVVGTLKTIPTAADVSPVIASRPNTSYSAGQARAQSGRPQMVYHTRSESAVARSTSQLVQAPLTQRKSMQSPPVLQPDIRSDSAARDFAEQPRRAPRTASERSLAELSKPFARPAMTSVPENNVPEDDATPPDSPGLYSFKGELPVDDKPQQDARLRSRSPPSQAHPAHRQTLAGGHPYSQMYAPMMSSQVYPGGRMGPRRATTHLTGYGIRPGASATHMRKSPLSSHETSPSPLQSERGSDAGRPTVGHVRSNSMRSSASTVNRPRTYFTHGGKVTVDPNAPKPEKPAEKAEDAAPPAEEKAGKKKRFSVSFGKKDKKDKK